jgi:hypothetical protein
MPRSLEHVFDYGGGVQLSGMTAPNTPPLDLQLAGTAKPCGTPSMTP